MHIFDRIRGHLVLDYVANVDEVDAARRKARADQNLKKTQKVTTNTHTYVYIYIHIYISSRVNQVEKSETDAEENSVADWTRRLLEKGIKEIPHPGAFAKKIQK